MTGPAFLASFFTLGETSEDKSRGEQQIHCAQIKNTMMADPLAKYIQSIDRWIVKEAIVSSVATGTNKSEGLP